MTEHAHIRASAVAIGGKGLLILGPSGAGKSALALDLIALGGGLIADDLVRVDVAEDGLVLSSPRPGPALIEARGIGLLPMAGAGPAPLSLVIDLGAASGERLPARRFWRRLDRAAPLIRRPEPLHPAAIRAAVLCGGPVDPELPVGAAGLASGESGDQSVGMRGESAKSESRRAGRYG